MPLTPDQYTRLEQLVETRKQQGRWSPQLEDAYTQAKSKILSTQPELVVARSLEAAGFDPGVVQPGTGEAAAAGAPVRPHLDAEYAARQALIDSPAYQKILAEEQVLRGQIAEARGRVASGVEQVETLARGEGVQQPLTTIPGVRQVAQGLASASLSHQSLIGRVVGDQDSADLYNRLAGGAQQAGGDSAAEQIATGVFNTVGMMAQTSGLGPAGMIGNFAAQATNQAITEGRDSGLEGEELVKFAVGQGAVEGLVSAAMQRVGLGGLEQSFKPIVKDGVLLGLRRFGIQTAAELGEEALILVGQRLNEYLNGVSEDALPSQEEVGMLVAQTLATMGLVRGANRVVSGRSPIDPTAPVDPGREDRARIDPNSVPNRGLWYQGVSNAELEAALARSDATLERARRTLGLPEADEAATVPETAETRMLPEPDFEGRADERLSKIEEEDLAQARQLEQGQRPLFVTPEGEVSALPRQTPVSLDDVVAEVARFDPDVKEEAAREADLPDPEPAGDADFVTEGWVPPPAKQPRGETAEAMQEFFAGQARETLKNPRGPYVLARVPVGAIDVNSEYQADVEAEYAQQPGHTAPPGLAGYSKDGDRVVVIDGNTRVRAAIRRGDETVSMYIPRADARTLDPEAYAASSQAASATKPPRIAGTTQTKAQRAQARRAAREGMREVADLRSRGRMMRSMKAIRDLADKWARLVTLDHVRHVPRKLEEAVGRKIAKAYEAMKHDPQNPAVRESYEAFKRETLQQFEVLKREGYVFEPWTAEGQPYASVTDMMRDIAENKHLYHSPTEKGFGDDSVDRSDHPLMEEAPGTGGLLYNDVFRIVHDFFGHAKDGHGFDIEGKENAWRSHSQMYSDQARGAMTSETRGRSSWVGYGPNATENKKAIRENRVEDVVFADQKAGLLPPEFQTAEGLRDGNAPGNFPPNDPDPVIDAVLPGVDTVREGRIIRDLFEKNAVPLASVIRRWAPRLYGRLKQHQAAYRRERHDGDFQVRKLEKAIQSLSREDRMRFLYLLQTKQHAEARQVLQKLEDPASASDTLQTILDIMEAWRARGIKAGLKIGYIEQHFPRQLKPGKYAEWSQKLTGEERTDLDQLILKEEARLGRVLSQDEREALANEWLGGRNYIRPGQTSPRILSRRSVDDLSFEDWQEFYQNDFTPAYSYVDRIVYNTLKAELFGKGPADETLPETIGRLFTDGAYGIDQMTAYQKNRLRSAIQSIYTGGEQSPVWAWRVVRDIGYVGTLLDPTSAATQLGDLALIAARDGTMPVLRAVPEAQREQVLTARNLGMEHLSEEYGSFGKLSTALRRGFKAVGFHRIDTAALTVNMVSARNEARRLARRRDSRAWRRLESEWAPVFGEQWPDLVRDLENGVNSDLVADYAYMQASETRPNDILDMPENYARHPNARILWQLKGFATRQFDFIRTRGYNKIARGVRNGDPKLAAEGLADLTRIMMILSVSGATFDWLRDWLLGRNPDLSRSMVDGLLYTHLGSMYLLGVAGREGPGSAIMQFVTPPVPGMMDTLWRDLSNGTYRTVQHLPFGKMIYSQTPEAKRRFREYARRDVLSAAGQAYADGDRHAAYTYVKAFNEEMRAAGRPERITMLSVKRSAASRSKGEN